MRTSPSPSGSGRSRRERRSGGEGRGSGGEEARALRLEGLTRRFGDVVAVRDFSLELEPGEFMTLLGPSGCGKTTVLRLIAGFETPDGGRVRFGGRDVTGLSPQKRGFGMVFQNYALFPHLDVFENVAFGLRARKRPRPEIEERVGEALERVDLPGLGSRSVQALSGGQQQRVALARALAIEPPLLLLDEPLSNLDAALRERTRVELRRLVKEMGITALFVTHDQEEAFDLSDRTAVMKAGRLRQVDTPRALYEEPVDGFVARFVGRVNALEAVVEEGQGGERVARLRSGPEWPVDEESRGRTDRRRADPGERGELLIRPEALRFVDGGEGALKGTVRDRRFRGGTILYRIEVPGEGMVEVVGDGSGPSEGEEAALLPRSGARLHLFPPEEE